MRIPSLFVQTCPARIFSLTFLTAPGLSWSIFSFRTATNSFLPRTFEAFVECTEEKERHGSADVPATTAAGNEGEDNATAVADRAAILRAEENNNVDVADTEQADENWRYNVKEGIIVICNGGYRRGFNPPHTTTGKTTQPGVAHRLSS